MMASTRTRQLTAALIVVVFVPGVCGAADVDRELVERVIERQKLYKAWKTLFVDAVYVQKTSDWTKYERGKLSENAQGLKRFRREKGEGAWRPDSKPDSIEEWIYDGNVTVRMLSQRRPGQAAQGSAMLTTTVDIFDAGRKVPLRNPYDLVEIGARLEGALRSEDIDEARLLDGNVAQIAWKQRVPNSFLLCTARVDMNAPAIPQTVSMETKNRKGDLLFSTSATFHKDRDVTALQTVSDIAYRMPVKMNDLGRRFKEAPEKIETTKLETIVTIIESRFDGEEEIEPKTFSIEIPLGTKVHDNRTGAEFIVSGKPLRGIDLRK
jgi:hypothetical protein